MNRAISVLLLVACAVSLARCGSNPNSPSTNGYPNVAGNYSGTMTLTIPAANLSLSCPATTTVTQSTSEVTLSPLSIGGSCATTFPSLPLGSFSIDTTGSIGSTTISNLALAACNGTYNATGSGGFSGSTFQLTLVYTAETGGCVTSLGNFTFAINLSR